MQLGSETWLQILLCTYQFVTSTSPLPPGKNCKKEFCNFKSSKASLSFCSLFLVTYTISCSLKLFYNIITLLAFGWMYDRSNSPPCGGFIKFPTLGEREGVKCPWYARGGGGGILMLQIDRCINSRAHTRLYTCVGNIHTLGMDTFSFA